MAISQMQKVNIIGVKSQCPDVVSFLESLNIIQINHIEQAQAKKHKDFLKPVQANLDQFKKELSELQSTIDFLSRFGQKTGFISGLMGSKILLSSDEFEKTALGFDYREIHKTCMLIQQELHKTEREIGVLHAQYNQLIPWKPLSLSLDTFNITETIKYAFLTGTTGKFAYFKNYMGKKFPLLHCEKASDYQETENIVAIYFRDQEKEILSECKKLGVERVDLYNLKGTVDSNLERISNQLKRLKEKHKTLNKDATELTRYSGKLKVAYDYSLSLNYRTSLQNKFLESNETFLLGGWLKKDNVRRFKKQISTRFPASSVIKVDPAKGEKAPIYLENKPIFKPFETVTDLYGTPANTSVDPTPFMAPFFFLFFGLCLTDAGYGLILSTIALLGLSTIAHTPGIKRFFKLILYVGISTIICGVFTGGWFGIEAEKLPVFLQKVIIFSPLKDSMQFFIIALALGFIQLYWGILIKVYNCIKSRDFAGAIFDQIPWLIIMPSLLLLTMGKSMGKWPALAGAAVIILFFGRDQKNPIARVLSGIVIGCLWLGKDIVGNILSYSRLMALGLSTAVIALVANKLAGIALGISIPGVNILLAVIILFVLHSLNFLVNSLGAYVHSSRLQYVEFFPYFFASGGEQFEPLSKNTKYTIIK
ncbi:MAG: V-type ATPase 116kDa subunit family protein [bacterium]|nr:V-type ATPase 116kDa subunit family protein [bacterium]